MKSFKLKDYLISLLIILVSLSYFIDTYFIPEDLESISVLGFEIGNFGFQDIYYLIYYVKMKLLIIILSVTWYLTCRYWWKYGILVIITIEFLKLFTALNVNNKYYDDIDYVVSLPLTLPIILVLIYLSHKINSYTLTIDLRNTIDSEIDNVFFELNEDSPDFESLKMEFKKIKRNTTNSTSYLNSLISLRNKFYSKF